MKIKIEKINTFRDLTTFFYYRNAYFSGFVKVRFGGGIKKPHKNCFCNTIEKMILSSRPLARHHCTKLHFVKISSDQLKKKLPTDISTYNYLLNTKFDVFEDSIQTLLNAKQLFNKFSLHHNLKKKNPTIILQN